MDRLLQLCIDSKGFSEKPSRPTIATIKKRLHDFKRTVTFKVFADMVANKGHTFYAGDMVGMNNEDWRTSSVIAFDYDNDTKGVEKYQNNEYITMNHIKETWTSLGLEPSLIYKSFSHTEEKHKCRVVWVLPEPITDVRVLMVVLKAMYELSIKHGMAPDDAVKKYAQMWLGGKGVYHKQERTTLNVQTLFDHLVADCMADTNGHANRRLKALSKTLGVNMVNNMPCIAPIGCLDNTGEVIEWNGLQIELAPLNDKGKATPTNTKVKADRTLRISLQEQYKACKLLDTMVKGEYLKEHPQDNHEVFFHLACNLHHVENGENLYMNLLERDAYTNKDNKRNAFRSANKSNYNPTQCEGRCPYYGGCMSHNILSCIIGGERLSIRKVEDIPTISLDQAREELPRIIDSILADPVMGEQTMVHGVKVDTGVGKSTYFANMPLEGIAFAVVTHGLGKQFKEDTKAVNPNIHYVEELDTTDMPREMQEMINNLYLMNGSVVNYLENEMEKYREHYLGSQLSNLSVVQATLEYKKNHTNDMERVNQLEQEKAQLKHEIEEVIKTFPVWYHNAYKYCQSVYGIQDAKSLLMTHKRLSYMTHGKFTNKHIHTIVFDEDPLNALVTIEQLNYTDVLQVVGQGLNILHHFDQYADLQGLLEKTNNLLSNLKHGDMLENPLKGVAAREDIKRLNEYLATISPYKKVNIIPLFITDNITRQDNVIAGVVDRLTSLPLKKIIILSATIDPIMWQLATHKAGRTYVHHEVGTVEYKGKLTLVAGRSYSKSSMTTSTVTPAEQIKQLMERFNINNVITYKEVIKNFKSAYDDVEMESLNFGNCLGYNHLQGKDILVVGQPNKPSWVYDLMGYFLTGSKPVSENWTTKKVTRYGYEFPLNTYTNDSDKVFTDIQLYYLYSDIIQAVGRSRLVSEQAQVVMVSNLPLPQTHITK